MELIEKRKSRGMLVSRDYELNVPPITGKKAIKVYNKETLIIELNGVQLQADKDSLIYMSMIVGLAHFKFNASVAQGVAGADAYTEAYKQPVPWKGADNQLHMVDAEFLALASEAAMTEIAAIIGVDPTAAPAL